MRDFSLYAEHYLSLLFKRSRAPLLVTADFYFRNFLKRIGASQGNVFLEGEFLFPEDVGYFDDHFLAQHVALLKAFSDKENQVEIEVFHMSSADSSQAITKIFIRFNADGIIHARVAFENNDKNKIETFYETFVSKLLSSSTSEGAKI